MVPFHGVPSHYYNMTIEGHKQLYGHQLRIHDTSVPMSGRAIWGLQGMLSIWINGLPAAHAEEFLDLRVRDLVRNPFEQLNSSYVRFLRRETNMEIAAITRIIGTKLP